MVSILSLINLFLSHLHDGELGQEPAGKERFFLSHLHDGELEGPAEQCDDNFLSHLHDGELNEFCYIFGYFNLLKNI